MSVATGNSVWPIATSVAAVQLGISRRALDAAGELAKAKPWRGRKAKLIENAHVQRQLMRAEGAWSAACAGAEQALVRMWRDAEQHRLLPVETRIASFVALIHASATATGIVESVCDIVGTSVAPATESSARASETHARWAVISLLVVTGLKWRRSCDLACSKTVLQCNRSPTMPAR